MKPYSTLSSRLLSDTCDDERVLASLFADTRAMLSKTDAVAQYLQQCAPPLSLSSSNDSQRRWQVRTSSTDSSSGSFARADSNSVGAGGSGDSRLALEMVESHAVPFAIELVSDVLQHMTVKRVPRSAYSAHAQPVRQL